MAVAAAEFAPEALELIEEAGEDARQFAYEVARQAGLTAEDDYRGWIPVLILAYRFLYPPVATALLIEKQLSGVLEQLYSWLGGVGTSTEKALDTFGSDLSAAGSAVTNFFEGKW